MKKTSPEQDQIRDTAEYYRLHTDAVDALVEADESNSPPVSERELKKYRGSSRFRVPEKIRVIFIKFWFSAAICFFFMWGLGSMDMLDTLVILSLASGVITDVLVNAILRFIAPKEGDFDQWMMYPSRKWYLTLLPNILHAGIVILLVYETYNIINVILVSGGSLPEDSVALGVEPILFGIFYLVFDLILIRMRVLAGKILADAKRAAGQHR